MRCIFFVTVLLANGHCSEGFPIRLWPSSSRGTEGFVEAFYKGSWGIVSNGFPQFTDATATFLCKTLGLSQFGYGSILTSKENYTGHSWLYALECFGNETTVDQCMRSSWHFNNYTSDTYGNKLHCTNMKLVDGETENTGIVYTAFAGKIYTICYDGFDMNAANVVCNHLRYNGAVNFSSGEPGSTHIYNKNLICEGNESSLTECNAANDINCSKAVYITCRAVRLTHRNEYNYEGAVEIYHNGSWGFVGVPRYSFDEVTATYLCEIFGFQNGAFSTSAHLLETYYGHKWLSSLTCKGNETHIMQCDRSGFGFVPSIRNTLRTGTWLHCVDFNIRSIRLVNGSTFYEGRVELDVNGRWGSVCTAYMHTSKESAAEVVCKYLGFPGMDKVLTDREAGKRGELFWMSLLSCNGTESSLMDCTFTKGPLAPCSYNPDHLAVQCIDIDECLSSPCLNGGSCENGNMSYTCQCPDKWSGTNCEIDLEYDACIDKPCLNNGTCKDLLEGFQCVCAIGFDGDICQNNIYDCEPPPCRNGGSCEDRVNGFKCYCLSGYSGINCQIEIESQTTLIAIITSATCLLLLGMVLIGCLCLRYRRKQKKTKSKEEPKPKPEEGAGQEKNTTEQEGYKHIYHSLKENAFETDHGEVYAEIKEGDLDDYLTPASVVGPAKDADSYLTFGNDENIGVRYYNLKDTKTDDYSKLSRMETSEDYSKLSRSETS